jgi:hypothetical protein
VASALARSSSVHLFLAKLQVALLEHLHQVDFDFLSSPCDEKDPFGVGPGQSLKDKSQGDYEASVSSIGRTLIVKVLPEAHIPSLLGSSLIRKPRSVSSSMTA